MEQVLTAKKAEMETEGYFFDLYEVKIDETDKNSAFYWGEL